MTRKSTIADLTPWKVLGRKWHFTRKGFAMGRQVRWDTAVLEELLCLLEKTAPQGEYVWGHKQVVPMYVPGQKAPWAAVQTKKPDAVYLTLTGPKGHFAMGRITALGYSPAFDAERPEADLVRLRFRSVEDLQRGDLPAFLKEHLASLSNGKAR